MEDSFAGGSWIHGAKYESETEIMNIYLADGEVMECEGVDQSTWNGFKSAKSKGKYFNAYIRGKFVSSSI